jgi:hypothetical protein
MPTPLPAPFRLTCHCTRSGLALIPNVSSSDTRYSQEVLTNTGNALTSYHHLATSTILYFCSVCGARLSTQDNSGRISPLIGCLDSSADVATVSELGVGNIPKKPTQDDDNADSLPGRCLCGAITFAILRPPEDYYDNTVLREWIKP